MLRVLLVVALLAAPALASTPVPPRYLEPPQSMGHSLEGSTCVAAEEDWCWNPLPGVTVTIHGPSGDLSTTSDWGWYSFRALEPGTYTVTAERVGFAPATVEVDVSGSTYQDLLLGSTPTTFRALVVDLDGAPVPGVELRWWEPRGEERVHRTDAAGRLQTDVMSGATRVEVSKAGYARAARDVVFDGSEVRFKLPLLPPQTAQIQGTVTDQHGRPVAGMDIHVEQWQHPWDEPEDGVYMDTRNSTRTGPDGGYSIRVMPGHAFVNGWKDRFEGPWGDVEVQDGQTVRLDLRAFAYPDRTAQLTATVTDAVTGAAVPDARIDLEYVEFSGWECSVPAVWRDEPGCAIRIDGSTMSGQVMPGYVVVRAYHDAWASCQPTPREHDVETHAVMPGTWSIADETAPPMETYLETSKPIMMEPWCQEKYVSFAKSMRLVEGENRIDIQLFPVQAASSSVTGYVLGDAPIPGAMVEFSSRTGGSWQSTQTDAHGGYRVHVSAGIYEVSVQAPGHLRWVDTILVADGEHAMDIHMEAGESHACCMAYAEAVPRGYAVSDHGEVGPDAGLGPYDAQKRQSLASGGQRHEDVVEAEGGIEVAPTPGLPVMVLLAALALIALARRR